MELVNTVVMLKKWNGKEEELVRAVVTDHRALQTLAEMFGASNLEIGDELVITYRESEKTRQIVTVRRTSKHTIQSTICMQSFMGVNWWG